jgi:7-cyano-7-deazaguanine reductase
MRTTKKMPHFLMRMRVSHSQLKSLGQSTSYHYAEPDATVLEYFPNPFADTTQNPHAVSGRIHIEIPEFTCVCPLTGQPDFATIIIDYVPLLRCIESKSLKLYIGRFRQTGIFHEACVNRMANDLITVLDPLSLRLEGRFAPRGGIPFVPIAKYQRRAGA